MTQVGRKDLYRLKYCGIWQKKTVFEPCSNNKCFSTLELDRFLCFTVTFFQKYGLSFALKSFCFNGLYDKLGVRNVFLLSVDFIFFYE